MSSPNADFLLKQRVFDQFRDIQERLREMEKVIAVHPDDLTDDLRGVILAMPFTTLRESTHLKRGTLFVISPGLLGDLTS